MNQHAATLERAGWRWPGLGAWLTTVCWLLGVGILLYPAAAAWFSQVNQAQLIGLYSTEVSETTSANATQLARAQHYNEALSGGALLAAGANVAVGAGELRSGADAAASGSLKYGDQLVSPSGVMARLRIPAINVDLPIFHGTAEDTLLAGLGHLEGTSLPVGGETTRSVITGHRGLASARMFTDLDRLGVGDAFTLETFGEVLSYRVTDVRVVAPEATETLHQEPGKDLVTLITCTPLGVNTHRILVTGERVTPTPAPELAAAGASSGLPGFPWWIAGAFGGVVVGAGYLVWSAKPKRR